MSIFTQYDPRTGIVFDLIDDILAEAEDEGGGGGTVEVSGGTTAKKPNGDVRISTSVTRGITVWQRPDGSTYTEPISGTGVGPTGGTSTPPRTPAQRRADAEAAAARWRAAGYDVKPVGASAFDFDITDKNGVRQRFTWDDTLGDFQPSGAPVKPTATKISPAEQRFRAAINAAASFKGGPSGVERPYSTSTTPGETSFYEGNTIERNGETLNFEPAGPGERFFAEPRIIGTPEPLSRPGFVSIPQAGGGGTATYYLQSQPDAASQSGNQINQFLANVRLKPTADRVNDAVTAQAINLYRDSLLSGVGQPKPLDPIDAQYKMPRATAAEWRSLISPTEEVPLEEEQPGEFSDLSFPVDTYAAKGMTREITEPTFAEFTTASGGNEKVMMGEGGQNETLTVTPTRRRMMARYPQRFLRMSNTDYNPYDRGIPPFPRGGGGRGIGIQDWWWISPRQRQQMLAERNQYQGGQNAANPELNAPAFSDAPYGARGLGNPSGDSVLATGMSRRARRAMRMLAGIG